MTCNTDPEIAHQKEVDLANNCVLQVIPALVILKLNVQAVLNADLHLQRDANFSAMQRLGNDTVRSTALQDAFHCQWKSPAASP